MNRRLRAICDLSMSTVREYAGRHEYDGRVDQYALAVMVFELLAARIVEADARKRQPTTDQLGVEG